MFTSRWIVTGIAVAAAGMMAGAALLVLPQEIQDRLPQDDIPLPAAAAAETVPQAPEDAPLFPEETLPDPEKQYLLKLRENTLYVYEEGAREASEQYELPAGWLPDYDRILLEYGMRCTGEREMRSLVEDYVS